MTKRRKVSRLRGVFARAKCKFAGFWCRFRRDKWIIMSALSIDAVILTLLFSPPPIFIWNGSASAPIGLYYVDSWKRLGHQSGDIKIDDMVVAWPPKAARSLAADRHYLPSDVPLIKRVAAAEYDVVCADGDQIIIDGGWVIPRRKADGKGRALPWWQGCHVLEAGELFLMMEEHPDSFDGRYFGVTAPGDVIGKASLIWAY